MTTQPAGWYPDPYAATPGIERYWDGQQWLSQTQSSDALAAGVPEGGLPYSGQYANAATPWSHNGGAQRQHDAAADGVQLASWGRRLGAYLLDAIPFVVLGMIGLSVLGFVPAMEDLLRVAATGDQAATEARITEFEATFLSQATMLGLTSIVLVAIYNIGFHVWKGQTPGKMLVGIRVRGVERDERPTLGRAALRWVVQFVPSQLAGLPIVGFVFGAFPLVDGLWPLWDAQKQALHDKAAKTLVVRSR